MHEVRARRVYAHSIIGSPASIDIPGETGLSRLNLLSGLVKTQLPQVALGGWTERRESLSRREVRM